MTESQREAVTASLIDLAAGNRCALNPVYDALWPVLRSFCFRVLGSSADAEDAAQEALVKVFQRAPTFDATRGDGVTWALTLAIWECRSAMRRRKRDRAQDPLPGSLSDAGPTPEAAAMHNQMLAVVSDLVGQLSETQQAALEAALVLEGGRDARQRKRKQRALAQLNRWWEMFNGRV